MLNGINPSLVIVVAVADNGVIGKAGELPWHLSDDLKRVKTLTLGKPLIMGRRTYESIGRPLPGRKTIVITQRSYATEFMGVSVCQSFQTAYDLALKMAMEMNSEEIIAFGGTRIYRDAIPLASRIYKTEIHFNPAGDAWFPKINQQHWREIKRCRFSSKGGDRISYSFVTLERIVPRS